MTRTRSTAKPQTPASSNIEMGDTPASANSQRPTSTSTKPLIEASLMKSTVGKKATAAGNKDKNQPAKKGADVPNKKCNTAGDTLADEEEEVMLKTVKKKQRTGTKSKNMSDHNQEEDSGAAGKKNQQSAAQPTKEANSLGKKDDEIATLKKRLEQSEARQSLTSAKLKQKQKAEFEKKVQENNCCEKAREAASGDLRSDEGPEDIFLNHGEEDLAEQLSGPAPRKDILVAQPGTQAPDKQHETLSPVGEDIDIDRLGQDDNDDDEDEDPLEGDSSSSDDEDLGKDDEISNSSKNGSRGGSISFGKENGMSHSTAAKTEKQKAKSQKTPGKPTKSQFPAELQRISHRLRAHFKASLALNYSSKLDDITWTWNLIKTFVKNNSEAYRKNDAQALHYLRHDYALKSCFIDYICFVLQVKLAFFHELVGAVRPLVPTCYGLGPTVPSEEVKAKVVILQTLSNFIAKNPYPKSNFVVAQDVLETSATHTDATSTTGEQIPPPKKKKHQAELKAPFTNVVIFNVVKEAWFKATGKQKIQPAILSTVQKSGKIPSSMIILAAVAVDHAVGEYTDGCKKEATFTEEWIKIRYQYYHSSWWKLEKKAPAYTKKIQQEMFDKIQASSNGKIPAFAELESNDMDGISHDDLQALAQGSTESLFDN